MILCHCNFNIRGKNHLSRTVKEAGEVTGAPQTHLTAMFTQQSWICSVSLKVFYQTEDSQRLSSSATGLKTPLLLVQ